MEEGDSDALEELTMRQEAGCIRFSMMLTDGRYYSRVSEVLLSL